MLLVFPSCIFFFFLFQQNDLVTHRFSEVPQLLLCVHTVRRAQEILGGCGSHLNLSCLLCPGQGFTLPFLGWHCSLAAMN